MNIYSRMVIVLTSVGIISGILLMSVGLLTQERIALNKQKEIEAAVIKVIPGASSSQKLYEEKDFTVYRGNGEGNQVLGYAFYTTISGFQDKIVFLFGTNALLTRINSLCILEQKETPGLGAKITDQEIFLKFWEGKDISRSLSLRKPPVSKEQLSLSEVNTITGATISSKSVLAGVNAALEKIKTLKVEGKFGGEGNNAK